MNKTILSLIFAILITGSTFGAEHRSIRDALEIGTKIRNAWPTRVLASNPEKNINKPGIRILRGKHLILYTDIPQSKEIDELPEIFDAAVPLWCEFFRIDPKLADNWKMLGVLVEDFKNFDGTPLLKEVPALRHGYSIGQLLWIREQKSNYYRRHLLLHEGVHGFMNNFFGFCGPRWYMEGLAELLGTHNWDDEKRTLSISWMPQNRDEIQLWGRIRLLQQFIRKNEGLTLETVLTMPFNESDDTYSYAWCWGAASFLNGHPLYKNMLRDYAPDISDKDFTQRFIDGLNSKENGRFRSDWINYISDIEYGYDFEHSAIKSFTSGKRFGNQAETLEIRSDSGWQNSGFLVEKGKSYTFTAIGRFQLGKEKNGVIWWSEPDGVTIKYYRGKPLGALIGAAASTDVNSDFNDPDGFASPFLIGASTVWKCPATGTLFLRVNDSPDQLEDNSGNVQVRISK